MELVIQLLSGLALVAAAAAFVRWGKPWLEQQAGKIKDDRFRAWADDAIARANEAFLKGEVEGKQRLDHAINTIQTEAEKAGLKLDKDFTSKDLEPLVDGALGRIQERINKANSKRIEERNSG